MFHLRPRAGRLEAGGEKTWPANRESVCPGPEYGCGAAVRGVGRVAVLPANSTSSRGYLLLLKRILELQQSAQKDALRSEGGRAPGSANRAQDPRFRSRWN